MGQLLAGHLSEAQTLRPVESEQTNAALAIRARDGDREAFAMLYRRNVERVYGFAARRLSTREEAEEATQETFVRALHGLGRFREDAEFAGWLFGIARHVVNERYRDRSHSEVSLSEIVDPEDLSMAPDEVAERNERSRELFVARERCLNPRDRQLFDLLLAELNDQEIATALGRSYGAIRTAHWRLLLRLRNCLGIRVAGEEAGHATYQA